MLINTLKFKICFIRNKKKNVDVVVKSDNIFLPLQKDLDVVLEYTIVGLQVDRFFYEEKVIKVTNFNNNAKI